jgi:hypothetical protein
MSDGVRSHGICPLLLAAFLAAGPVQAQIVTDGTVGPKVSLSGGQIEIGADLGSRRGDNLFHSFEKFGITTGQTATFTGPGTIKNVISRVTGGSATAAIWVSRNLPTGPAGTDGRPRNTVSTLLPTMPSRKRVLRARRPGLAMVSVAPVRRDIAGATVSCGRSLRLPG